MIIPDINLLVYAYNSDAPHHRQARSWWEGLMNADQPVGLPWAVMLGYLRLMTHRVILAVPLDPRAALAHVRSWLLRPNVEILEPGPRHLEILDRLLGATGVGAHLTTDAHLGALA